MPRNFFRTGSDENDGSNSSCSANSAENEEEEEGWRDDDAVSDRAAVHCEGVTLVDDASGLVYLYMRVALR